MVIKNSKGMLKAFGVVVTFSLVSVMMIFILYLIFTLGNNYIAVPLINVTNVTNFDPMINAGIEQAGLSYQNTNLQMIDWGFFFGLVVLTSTSLSLSYYSRCMNYFSFLSILTYGLMFLMFIVSMMEITTDWIYTMLVNLLPSIVINLPIFNWFLSYIGVYLLTLMSVMLLLNQVDFDLAVIYKRKDKENDVFDDEVL